VDYTAEQYIDVLNTYSGHIAMTPAEREVIFTGVRELMASRGNRPIHKRYLGILHVAPLLDDAEA
jgi:hypothetical protein